MSADDVETEHIGNVQRGRYGWNAWCRDCEWRRDAQPSQHEAEQSLQGHAHSKHPPVIKVFRAV